MSFELPEDPRTARRDAFRRWLSFALVALLVALLAYFGYIGFAGSGQLVKPVTSRDCRTPAFLFGWEYQAVNYDRGSDERVNLVPDPADCAVPVALAGPELRARDGIQLAAWYVPAASGIGRRGPTVVLAHGYGSNKSAMLPRAAVLHDDYNLVLFDFRNHGQSSVGPTTVGVTERRDLEAVIDWLTDEKGPDEVAVLGVSMGGGVAAGLAATDLRVDALILESTHATLANAIQARLERAGYPLSLPAAWSVLLGGLLRTGQDMSTADPVQWVGRYGHSGRPLLILAGGRDDAVGATDADDLLAAAEEGGADARLRVCPRAGHGVIPATCPDDYANWVLGFLRRALAPS